MEYPQPWTPKAGTSETEEDREARLTRQMEERAAAIRKWEMWQAIRRYFLVLLIAFLGGMIGAAFTLVVLHH